ncbi:unnamed protein product [Linum trigynum]|uniref:Uncharacterized protein n=1 Tax=Linum trigynum TaxID=586398 RepID=A0AAV2FM24_9ROSI
MRLFRVLDLYDTLRVFSSDQSNTRELHHHADVAMLVLLQHPESDILPRETLRPESLPSWSSLQKFHPRSAESVTLEDIHTD